MGRTHQKWLVATEKCVISCSRWGSLSQLLLKRAHAGGSHSEGFGGQPLASRLPTWPSQSLAVGSRSSQGRGRIPSLRCWLGHFKLFPGCGAWSSLCVASVQGTAGVESGLCSPSEPHESMKVESQVVFKWKSIATRNASGERGHRWVMRGGGGERLFRDLCPPTPSPLPYLHTPRHVKFLFSFYSSPWPLFLEER